jgi:signal transduction histidine kinase
MATLSAVVVAVILLGVPLSVVGVRYVMDSDQQRLSDRLDRFMAAFTSAEGRGEPVSDVAIISVVQGRAGDTAGYLTVNMPDGSHIGGGTPITGPTMTVGGTTESGTSVTLTVSSVATWVRGAQLVTLVTAVAVVAVGAGVTIAVWQANRLSAPLMYLAASAEQLGSGQVRPRLEPSGVEEIDLVADELARTSDRLAGRLAAERQFASDASHQLRTPLTALSMRLEEIQFMSDNPDVQEEARISLEQVERLVGVVADLRATSRRLDAGTTEPVTMTDIAAQQAEEWATAYAEAGRELVFDIPESLRVLATPGALAQVVATLIENSLKHGGGTTTLTGSESGGSVTLELRDQGDGVPDELATRIFERGVTSGNGGTGLGLALARDLVATDGGRIVLKQQVPAVFAIHLAGVPKGFDPGVVLPPGSVVSPRRRRRARKQAASEVARKIATAALPTVAAPEDATSPGSAPTGAVPTDAPSTGAVATGGVATGVVPTAPPSAFTHWDGGPA